MAKTRSQFTTDYSEDAKIAILVDLNGDISVTNDAEQVVQVVYDRKPVDRIVYRDSDKNWDELVFAVVNGRAEFRKFAPVTAQLAQELDLHAR